MEGSSASPPTSPPAAATSSTAAGVAYEVVPHAHKAAIWDLFEKIKLLSDGTYRARCTLCGKHLALGGNSTLQRHVKSCTSKSAPKERQAPPTPQSPSAAATLSAATSSAATSSTAMYEVVPHGHKAAIWEFFEKIKLLSDGTFKARCTLCGKHLALRGNSTLQRHVKACTSQSAPEASPSPSPSKKIK